MKTYNQAFIIWDGENKGNRKKWLETTIIKFPFTAKEYEEFAKEVAAEANADEEDVQ